MAWGTPMTATYEQIVTSTEWNTEVRDRMNYLFARPFAYLQNTTFGTTNTTSTSAVDIDLVAPTTDLDLTITTESGRVWYSMSLILYGDVANRLGYVGVSVNGVTNTASFQQTYLDTGGRLISFHNVLTGLTTGSALTIRPQWYTQSPATITMYALPFIFFAGEF